ncbi:MAG: FAD-binding oxidoreductase [Amaricoccus sp.]|uniref:NAD(P)/FAD-dependent oxidoreductase n=1 Tax=Amaricoccus sp. TaxID=1872485 RepID=UPI0039E5CE8C
MSRQLDLRTGRPVWSAYRAPKVPVTPLSRDVRTDVLVVGMGISGAMIAEALTDAGHAVMAIDRRGPMLGSTAATTALVQFELDTPLTTLVRSIGKDAAQRAWRRSRLAVGNLMGRIEALGIDCRLSTRRSLYLAGDVLDAEGLAAEAAARRAAGIDARFLDARGLREGYGVRRAAAIESAANLALDPRKLTAGLLLAAQARGARLHAPVEATAFAHSADGVDVATAGGPVIRAGHVVLATGYELTDPVPAADHRVISTWAIATRPQPRAIWPHAAFMWEASDPYLYLRATHDGRLICGGEDEDFTDEEARDALIPEKTEAIARKLARLLPGIDPTPEFAWAGAFGSTETGMPIIRRLARKPRMHAVMGYGGNGITFSRLAAEIVTTEIGGGEDRDARLFAGGDE